MRTASYRVCDLQNATIPLGFAGENLHRRIIFHADEVYAEYPHAAASLTVRPPYGEPYPAVVARDGNDVLWDVKDSDLVRSGMGELQLSFTEDAHVCRTYVGKTRIGRSIQPTGDVPDPLEDFLTEAGAALTAIPETIDAALEAAKESGEFDGPQGPEGPAGQDGQPGADGYSPTITVTDITGGHRLTITDKNGTRTVDVMDGEDGQPGQDGQDGAPGTDGFSPVITVTDITGGHRLTITTATGTQTVDVMDGSGGDPTTLIDDTSTALDKVWSANKTSELKSAINEIEHEFPDINGKIFTPPYELGTRYVSNGSEAWSSNNVRMSTKRGAYVSLKKDDIIEKASSVIQYFGGGYSTDGGTTFISISAQTGRYIAPANGIYFLWLSKPGDAAFTDADIANGASYVIFTHPDSMESKMSRFTELDMVEAQLPELNGAIVPPEFSIGTRYVNNGVDTWLASNIRLSIAQGKYITLKQGDVVTINSSYVYAFGGGYSTNNGATWTAISNRIDAYTAPVDGIYFFCLAKSGDAAFAESEIDVAWKYISFTRPDSIKETVEELVENDATDSIKTAIGYEIAPLTPTDYYTITNPNKGLNYLGELVDDSGQDASDYIELTNLYDIARVVPNTSKYGLGSICYYTASKQFIAPRVQPGTDYSFSIYNGETVAWLSIDKTVANAKYVRFCGENNRNYKYWVVYNAPQASVLDDYSKYKLLSKKIVNFGDSIFGLTRPPKDVSSYLANITGATVYNAGFGGCEMSNHADANYNPFSMCNLADAIATGTWTAQESAASASGMPAYFAETVAMLKSLDFSKIDIATIGYGTNDWNNGTQLDGGTNTDKTYYADALRYSIETLLTAYPNLKIFVCTQTYRFFMNASYEFVDDCTTHTNSQGKTLTDFVDKTIEVADAYNVPYIDNYHIGINKFDRSYYFYPTDGTHPMPIGNQLIAENMANKMF